MYKARLITERLKKLISNFPVVVLTGARQVGKSTLLEHVFPTIEMVVFDPVIDLAGARKDPDLFLDNHPAPVIFDEIQYAPELVAAIKRRVDKNRKPGLYILTGSQQWSVMKSIADSLAGRAVFLHLEGFELSEMYQVVSQHNWLEQWLAFDTKNKFAHSVGRIRCTKTLYEHLWRGWLPGADSLDTEFIPDFYRGYLQTYIERDARLQMEVNDWQQFGKFVQLVSALTAQEVNYSQLGREIGINYQTAQKWLSVLKSTFQWFEAPAYSGNSIKKISGKPKGYISDTGLACALNQISTYKAIGGNPLFGALFETAVASQIRKLSYAMPTPPQIYHWRSHGGAEVDLLLERDGTIYPIEIKAKSNPTVGDTTGITAFRRAYPKLRIADGLIICSCERFLKISEQDYAMPWDGYATTS